MDVATDEMKTDMDRLAFCIKRSATRVCCRYRKEYSDNPVFTMFITLLLMILMASVAAAIITNAETVYMILSPTREGSLMDYFASVVDSSDGPYARGVIYPPLATAFYAAIGYFVMPFVEATPGENILFALRVSQLGLMSYIIITMLTFYALHLIVSRLMKNMNVCKELLFILLILLSLPFIFAVQRGNSIIITLAFCLIFLMGYRSENKWVRYASYVSLGCASGFKLYPAILWLLLLRERNIRESIICALIVAALIFIPFIFTDGTPMMLFDSILGHTAGRMINDDMGLNGIRNIGGLVSSIFLHTLSYPEGTVLTINYVILGVFTIMSFIVILFGREMKFWKAVALLSCNLIIGFGTPTSYTHVYFALPALFFLVSEKELTKNNLFYLICFVAVMALWSGFEYGTYMTLRTSFVTIVSIALIFEGLRSICRSLRRHGNSVDLLESEMVF